MRSFAIILFFLSFQLLTIISFGQNDTNLPEFKGQFSSLAHFNRNNNLPLLLGGRYIPQLNYAVPFKNNKLIDFEYSANMYGNIEIDPFKTSKSTGTLKNYRAWVRYSTKQLELRAGLQKINFGSANLLRPLMWFDQIDPRDPLRLTDGVWGVLGRYYFLNNTNIWVWALYGNKNPKGWELTGTSINKPEFGGRTQFPIPKGEIAFSFHHRKTHEFEDTDLESMKPAFPENRFGFDARFDTKVGWWIEASIVTNTKIDSYLKNQQVINIGLDYTFGIGNGLYLIYEQLLASYDKKAFDFENTMSFSLFNLSYPIGLFDNLSAILYYDWTNNNTYNFVNWQKQFNDITLYLMAYWNPKDFNIPTQASKQNLYGGKGIQVMFVWNH